MNANVINIQQNQGIPEQKIHVQNLNNMFQHNSYFVEKKNFENHDSRINLGENFNSFSIQPNAAKKLQETINKEINHKQNKSKQQSEID
jgi:hypothetical protein